MATRLNNSLKHLASNLERWATLGKRLGWQGATWGKLLAVHKLTNKVSLVPAFLERMGSLGLDDCLLCLIFWSKLKVPSLSQLLYLSLKWRALAFHGCLTWCDVYCLLLRDVLGSFSTILMKRWNETSSEGQEGKIHMEKCADIKMWCLKISNWLIIKNQ